MDGPMGEGVVEGGRVYTKHKCPSRKRDFVLSSHTYILCYFLDTLLSFSWRAQPGWTFPGAWYHVLNRGAERRAIFRSKRCCEKFIQLLSSLPERFEVRLHGYALTWTQIVQAVSNVWNEPWEELLTARGTGARQTALFIGRIRGRLSLKELWRLAGGIHHNAVGIAIRRFTQRLQRDRTLLEKVALVQKELEPR